MKKADTEPIYYIKKHSNYWEIVNLLTMQARQLNIQEVDTLVKTYDILAQPSIKTLTLAKTDLHIINNKP